MSASTALSTPEVDAPPAAAAWRRQARAYAASALIGSRSETAGQVHFVVSGWACEARLLPDGARQIVRLLLPGDVGGLRRSPLNTFIALTPCEVASVPWPQIEQAQAEDRALAALTKAQQELERRIAEELLISLGRRRALGRAGHLLCELYHRQGGRERRSCDMPLSQDEMADILGLSVVHVNRVLKTLRQAGLLELSRRRLHLPDFDRLAELSGFDPAYLQLRSSDT